MPDVLDLVEPTLLERTPPRQLPFFFVPNLIGEYLLERPRRALLDPFMVVGLLAALGLLWFGAGPALWSLLLVALVLRIGIACWWIYRDVREDYLLLREGVVTTAHIISVRTCRDSNGDLAGAYVDCAIPITRRLTSVGSVWMPDTAEAARLGQVGRVTVIALTRSPGTWRLRESDGPHLRYEPTRE